MAWLQSAAGSKENRNLFKCSTGPAHLSDNHLCLPDICIIIPSLCLFFINSRLATPLWKALSKRGASWGEQAKKGGNKKKKYTHGQAERRQRDSSVKENHKVVMNQQRLDMGWKRWNVRQREAGTLGGGRVGLDANSSHLEGLMDRGQHFCTYPGSLPPHSITRQSIKSSKKKGKKKKKSQKRQWLKLQGYRVAFCCFAAFISTLMGADSVPGCLRVEWYKDLFYFQKTECAKVIQVLYYRGCLHQPEEMPGCCRFRHISRITMWKHLWKKKKKLSGCLRKDWICY